MQEEEAGVALHPNETNKTKEQRQSKKLPLSKKEKRRRKETKKKQQIMGLCLTPLIRVIIIFFNMRKKNTGEKDDRNELVTYDRFYIINSGGKTKSNEKK